MSIFAFVTQADFTVTISNCNYLFEIIGLDRPSSFQQNYII